MSNIVIVDSKGEHVEHEFEGEAVSPAIASRQTDPDFDAALAYLPNPDMILEKMGEKISIYKSMLADDEVWSSFEKLCDGAKRHKYELRQGKLDDKTFQMLTDYFDEFKWTGFIEKVLLARMFGFQPLEILWHTTEAGILPKSIEARPQARFLFSPVDNSPLLITKDFKEGTWKPEWNNSFLFPTYHGAESPYGTAVLGRCYWNVVAKRGGIRWWTAFLEKYGTPWLVLHHAGKLEDTDKKALFDAGKAAIRDAVLLIPENVRAEILESSGKSQSTGAHESFLLYHDKKISKVITSESMTSSNNGTGSYAASQTAESLLDTAINSCVELVTETAEDLARLIEMINFGTGAVITFDSFDPMFTNMGLVNRDKELFAFSGRKPSDTYLQRAYKMQPEDFMPVSTAEPAPEPQTFSGESKLPPDQVAIDKLGDTVFNDTKTNQAAIQKMIEPVMKYINGEETFAGAQSKLSAQFPKMDTEEIQKLIYKLLATGKLWGQISAVNED